MLIAGGWTYNSIIATKPELEKKIGTELDARPARRARTRRSRAAATSCSSRSPRTRTLGAAFIDFMLEPEQLNKFTSEIGFLPGTTDGIKASGYLEDPQRKPFAEQLLDHCAVYPPSPKWGGLEGANIFDGEIQKVMKGQATSQQARGRARRRRWTRSSPGEQRTGSRQRGAPARPAAAAAVLARRAVARLTLPVLLLLPALIDHRRPGRLSARADGLPVVHRHRAGRADLRRRRRGSGWTTSRRSSPTSTCARRWSTRCVFGTACVVGTMVLGFAVALLLNQRLHGNCVLRDRRAAAVGGAGARRERDLEVAVRRALRVRQLGAGAARLRRASRTTRGSRAASAPTSRSSSPSSGSRSRSSRCRCWPGCRRSRRRRCTPPRSTARPRGSASGW